jgi:hypothetical protein
MKYDVSRTQQIVDKLVKIAESKFGEPFTVTINLWNDDTFHVGVEQNNKGTKRLSHISSKKNCVFEKFPISYALETISETIDINTGKLVPKMLKRKKTKCKRQN